MIIYESEIEQIALDILRDKNGYTVLFGPDISEGEQREREYTDVVLQNRLRDAIDRINPSIPADAREEAFKKAMRTISVNLLGNNEAFHRMLTEGVDVKFGIGEGKTRGDKVWLIDFSIAENNEFLAVNQYTVLENHNNKRPDIVLFVNGLPLVVVELKNSTDENADIHAAFNQLQTYKQLIPSLFTTNAFLHFIVFEKTRENTLKKIAAYHQYYAVNKAITSTIRATFETAFAVKEPAASYGLPSVADQPKGDRRAGVVWHTQGKGNWFLRTR